MMNWRDVFPIQQLKEPTGKVFHIIVDYDSMKDTTMKLKMISQEVSATLTEEELLVAIDEQLQRFTHTSESSHQYDIIRADNNVARRSRRGRANAEWNGVRFYRSLAFSDDPNLLARNSDGPFVIAEYDGMFGISLNPNFDDYGFIIQHREGDKFC